MQILRGYGGFSWTDKSEKMALFLIEDRFNIISLTYFRLYIHCYNTVKLEVTLYNI